MSSTWWTDCRLGKTKEPSIRRALFCEEPQGQSVAIDPVVANHHVVTDLHLGRITLRDRGVLAILELHDHLPAVIGIAGALTDRMTGKTATHRACDGGRGLAFAAKIGRASCRDRVWGCGGAGSV